MELFSSLDRPWFATWGASLALLVWFLWRARRKALAVPSGSWVALELKGAITELPQPGSRLQQLVMREPDRSLWSLRRQVERLAKDTRVVGVLVELGDIETGWATAMGLRELILQLKSAGKKVVAWLPHGGSTREYFIAVAADKVLTTPQATIAPTGFAAGGLFYRTLLAKGGIEAEVLARKEFKSAGESFSRDGFSDESKLQTGALLDALQRALIAAVSAGRNKTPEEVKALIDAAPFRPKDAIEQGLVDGVAYEDELPARLGIKKEQLVPLWKYARFNRQSVFERWEQRSKARIGVIPVHGAIVLEAPVAMGRVADVPRIVGALRAAREDESLKAVVLHVDSPGGSALASDLIAREVERLKEKKPVIAYFSDVAASGGYYVAANADEIVAQPLSITGSIGVILVRFVFQKTLEKLGLSHEVLRRGAHSDVVSPYRHWTDEERALFDKEIDGFYEDFVGIVARGRKRPSEEIEPLARGRVYAGEDARSVGLVDVLGGLTVAFERAAERASLRSWMPVLVHPPRMMPEPPEPPPALQPFVAKLGPMRDLVNLALATERERVLAFEDRLPW